MRLEIQEHGVMCSGFFGGTSGVMLPVSVDRNTTLAQLIGELQNEADYVWDHITYIAEKHGYNIDNLETDIDEQLARMIENISDNPNIIYCENLDYSFEEIDDSEGFDELPVAIFTIEFIND